MSMIRLNEKNHDRLRSFQALIWLKEQEKWSLDEIIEYLLNNRDDDLGENFRTVENKGVELFNEV